MPSNKDITTRTVAGGGSGSTAFGSLGSSVVTLREADTGHHVHLELIHMRGSFSQ